jgi:hypothetical protein
MKNERYYSIVNIQIYFIYYYTRYSLQKKSGWWFESLVSRFDNFLLKKWVNEKIFWLVV